MDEPDSITIGTTTFPQTIAPDITRNITIPLAPWQPSDGSTIDWASRYMTILGVPLTHSKKDPCYDNLFLDLFEYILRGRDGSR